MNTSVEYFGPRVKRTGVRIEQDMPFLLEAKSAFLGHRIEDSSFINNFP